MKFKTFTIGWTLVMAIFLFAQRRPQPAARQNGFSAAVDLTHRVQGRDAAPYLSPAAWTMNRVRTNRLIAPLVLLDVTEQARRDADYQVTVEDIADWEQQHGHIPAGAVVLARTGWAARWNSVNDYRNADRQGTMHFPGFSLEAARFLAESRGVSGLGSDTSSIDSGASRDLPVRHYTSQHNLYHLENVADMSAVPEAGAVVVLIAAPAGSSVPVRMFALLRR
jgi:kynurenine formamidase